MEIHSMLGMGVKQRVLHVDSMRSLEGKKCMKRGLKGEGLSSFEIAYGWMDTANLQRHSAT